MERPQWAYMTSFSMDYLKGWHKGYRKARKIEQYQAGYWKGTPWGTGQSYPTEHVTELSIRERAWRRNQEAGL